MKLPFQKKKIPIKITPCPIIDTSVEIRFTPNVHQAAVFGIIFGVLKQEYPSAPETLPIVKIPEDIRNSDPQLKYQPHFKIANNNYVIQIGPNSISIGCLNEYPGWNVYIKKIIDTFNNIIELNIAYSINRIGLRYINFFKEVDIFNKLDPKISTESNYLVGNRSLLSTEIRENNLNHLLQISNHANIIKNQEQHSGSLIDIDVSKDNHLEDFFNSIEKHVNILHESEKVLFFSLLNDEFLNNFNPKYNA